MIISKDNDDDEQTTESKDGDLDDVELVKIQIFSVNNMLCQYSSAACPSMMG